MGGVGKQPKRRQQEKGSKIFVGKLRLYNEFEL